LPLLTDHTEIAPVELSGELRSSAQEMAGYVHTELGRGISPDGTWVVPSDNPGCLRRCILQARRFLMKTVGNG
jgi:hypothetical protein